MNMETEVKWQLCPEVLTHGTVPCELFGVNPRTIKGDAWWNRERKKAYASTDYHCIACGVHKSEAKYHQWLEAHEYFKIDRENLVVELEKIIPLCHACHNFIHIGRLYIFTAHKKLVPIQRFKEVLEHGFKVLKDAGFHCPSSNLAMAQFSRHPHQYGFGKKDVDNLGLKPNKKFEISDEDWEKFKRKKKETGGWRLKFEGKLYAGKTMQQLCEEYK